MEPLSGGLKVAVYIVTLIFIYFIAATIKSQYVNEDIAKSIITYLQSILMLISGYYWGSSSKQKFTKDSNSIEHEAREAADELEVERIEAAKRDAELEEAARIKVAEDVSADVIKEAAIATRRGESPDDSIKPQEVINDSEKDETK